jgi:hypothetical protein
MSQLKRRKHIQRVIVKYSLKNTGTTQYNKYQMKGFEYTTYKDMNSIG